MKTVDEIAAWIVGAAEEFGDPSAPVCLAFFRWVDGDISTYEGRELAAGAGEPGSMRLFLLPGFGVSIPVVVGEAQVGEEGDIVAFGTERIAEGLWALDPSLNIPGRVHCFVIIYGVHERLAIQPGQEHKAAAAPPWERLVVGG